MKLTVKGADTLITQLKALTADFEKKVVDTRKEAAKVLTEAIVENVPVWSGRTLEAMAWSNGGNAKAPRAHPDRGDFSTSGKFRYHPEFGRTSKMGLGGESQRKSAESSVRSSLGAITYDLEAKVVLTDAAPLWGMVDTASAPDPNSARNHAIVSEIGQEAVVARVPGVKRS